MLGQGVYLLRDVANYTGLPSSTVRAWFKWSGKRLGAVFKSDYDPIGKDYAISFLNLIDVYVAAFLRKEGVKPRTIRRAHEILQKEMGTPHPFAREDLCTDGVSVIKRDMTEKSDIDLIDVITKQQIFNQLERRLTKIKYNAITRLAEAWRIADGVIVKPGVNFGMPVIEDTAISTLIVAKQYKANGGNAALVARLFKITELGVNCAYQFERGLRRVAA